MDTGAPNPSRARRRRTRRHIVVVVTAVLVLAVALAGCSGGGDSKDAKPATTVAPKTKVDIQLGEVSADSAGGPVTITPAQSQQVLDALTTYVQGATVQPLRSGTPATADFGAVFDPATLASATTTDRGVMLDEGLPKVTGNLTVTAQPITLVGLGDQSGNLTLVSAALLLDAKGTTGVKGAAPLHVVRNGSFTLQPDPSGTWKITAYNVTVIRDGADLTPKTTSATTTTGAKK
jgi:hypothetical protein